MNSVTQEKVKLESDLHEALALRQFELHYSRGRIPGERAEFTASRRWCAGGIAAGAWSLRRVHSVAEACGLIDSIGAWWCAQACAGGALAARGLPPLRQGVGGCVRR